MSLLTRPFLAGKLLACLTVSLTFAASALAEDKRAYKMTLDSKLLMDLGETKQAVDAFTEFEYTWQKTPTTRSLIIDGASIKAANNGKTAMSIFMNRQKMRQIQDGKTTEVPFDEAPPALQNALKDSFGVPLLELQVDAHGKETGRKVTAGPGAKDLLENGVLANGLLFHSAVPAGETEWQSDTEISMGNGGYARGKLTYKKIADRKGDVYAVTGTLTNEKFPKPGTPIIIQDVRYVVNGEQTYDAAQKEWASGKLKFDVGFQMTAEGKTLGSAKGTMEASLQTRK